jgi:hypothetical protein
MVKAFFVPGHAEIGMKPRKKNDKVLFYSDTRPIVDKGGI